jgi:hypothetical protein
LKPAAQLVAVWQTPPEQVMPGATLVSAEHFVPQALQLLASVLRLMVQPPVAGLAQNEKPGWQELAEQTPPVQTWTLALARLQATPHLPH